MSNPPTPEANVRSSQPPTYKESQSSPVQRQEETTAPQEHQPTQSTGQKEQNSSDQTNQQIHPPPTQETQPPPTYNQEGQQTRYYYMAPPTNNATYLTPNTQTLHYVGGQNQIVYDYEPVSTSFSAHMAVACLVLFMCGIFFGLVAFILAGL